MYEKVSSNFDFVSHEKAVLDFWKKNDIFEKSIENREGCPTYTFTTARRPQTASRTSVTF